MVLLTVATGDGWSGLPELSRYCRARGCFAYSWRPDPAHPGCCVIEQLTQRDHDSAYWVGTLQPGHVLQVVPVYDVSSPGRTVTVSWWAVADVDELSLTVALCRDWRHAIAYAQGRQVSAWGRHLTPHTRFGLPAPVEAG